MSDCRDHQQCDTDSPDTKDRCEINGQLNEQAVLYSRHALAGPAESKMSKEKSFTAAAPAVVKPSKASFFRANLRHIGLRRTATQVPPNDSESSENRSYGAIIIVATLIFLFLVSFVGFVVMWFTNIYNNTILENLILSNGSTAVEWWQTPPVDPYLRLHIFNYTNTERWLQNLDDKLKVEDLGPYVYKEKFEKVQVKFNDNFTITYKERRTYEFLPNESNGRQFDRIVFPNVVLMTAASKTNTYSSLTQSLVNGFLNANKAFSVASAHDLIWGYNDALYNSLKPFTSIKTEKFGMLATRQGVSADTITIFTGEDDIDKLAVIDRFNGEKNMHFWATDECNRIDGTDGSQFPPYYMDKKHPLDIFSKAFCRKFPLYYDSEVNIMGGIPAWRYKAPLNAFSNPDQNPNNQCFCNLQTGLCPPDGVFDVSKCFDEAPIMLSFPHFFTGDDILFKHLDGLSPNEENHRSYADVHPRLAFPISGASRVQINVQVHNKESATSFLFGNTPIRALEKFEDKQILPVIWMEIVSGEITSELRSIIYHSTFSTNAIQFSLNYGTLLMCATSFGLLVLIFVCSQQPEEGAVDAEKPMEFVSVDVKSTEVPDNVLTAPSAPSVEVTEPNKILTAPTAPPVEVDDVDEVLQDDYLSHPHRVLDQQVRDGELD